MSKNTAQGLKYIESLIEHRTRTILKIITEAKRGYFPLCREYSKAFLSFCACFAVDASQMFVAFFFLFFCSALPVFLWVACPNIKVHFIHS